ALCLVLIFTLLQGGIFQYQFHRRGPERAEDFDADYPQMLSEAISLGSKPIYLVDDPMEEESYIHAYWYATLWGIDVSQFVHLENDLEIPDDALVIGTAEPDENCKLIRQMGIYYLYVQQ